MSIPSLGSSAPIQGSNSGLSAPPKSKLIMYVKVDNKSGMWLTSTSELASTPLEVNNFMKKYGNRLGVEQLSELQKISLKNGRGNSFGNLTSE